MPLSRSNYDFIRALIAGGDFRHPILAEKLGYNPNFRECHITAERIKDSTGWPMLMGLALLDKNNAMLVWPHVVNLRPDESLIDFSPPPAERLLAFTPFDWDTDRFNSITAEYNAIGDAVGGIFGDVLADQLTTDFHSHLRYTMPVTGKLPSVFI